MDYPISFNPKPSTIMHLDLNSCFATIEQQANPLLRGKPVVVAAYNSPRGCILAASIEAKRYGIKTGMRVKDGRLLYPELIVLPPDPWKYRYIHRQLRRLLEEYTDQVIPKSIDEFVMDLEGYPAFNLGMKTVAQEIKKRIKQEIGDWLTVSVGIGPNRFLTKTAANLHKPDGLDEINKDNFEEVYRNLKLTDLCGIKIRNAARLNNLGIFTVEDFYRANIRQLKAAFSSVCGYYWYLRLHGWEIDDIDLPTGRQDFGRRSYGNSFALPKPLNCPNEVAPILQKLVEKTGARLRRAGFWAGGVHVGVLFRDFSWWHHGHKLGKTIFDSRDIYKEAFKILCVCPYKKPVREISVSCFNLLKCQERQLNLLEDLTKKENLVAAMDEINRRYGDFVITPARMLYTTDVVHDRIAFGGMDETI